MCQISPIWTPCVVSLCIFMQQSGLFGKNIMRCYSLIRFHGIWDFRVPIRPSPQRHSAVIIYTFKKKARYVEVD